LIQFSKLKILIIIFNRKFENYQNAMKNNLECQNLAEKLDDAKYVS